MARTLIDGADQIEAGSIIRASINTATTGSALLTKLIAGTGLTLTQTGVDGGTGDVTASVSYGTIAGTAAQGNDSRITGALSASAAASTYAPIASPTFTGSVGSNGSVFINWDFPALVLSPTSSSNLQRWRLVGGQNGARDGSLIIQHTTDNFVANFTNSIVCDTAGNVTLPAGLSVGGWASAPSFSTAGSGVGFAVLFVGNATGTGYISFYDASNVRQGYIGYATASGQIQLENEGTATGYNVTGNLTVAGTTTLTTLSAATSAAITGLTTTNPVVDANANAAAPTTGTTVTIAATTSHQIINPSGTLAALTVVSPAAPSLGTNAVQSLDILFTQAITALTWTAGSGTTFGGAAMPTSCAAGVCVRLLWVQSLSKWLHTIVV